MTKFLLHQTDQNGLSQVIRPQEVYLLVPTLWLNSVKLKGVSSLEETSLGGGDSAQHWGDSVPARRLEWNLESGVGIDTWRLCQDREFGPGIRHRFGSGFQLIK